MFPLPLLPQVYDPTSDAMCITGFVGNVACKSEWKGRARACCMELVWTVLIRDTLGDPNDRRPT